MLANNNNAGTKLQQILTIAAMLAIIGIVAGAVYMSTINYKFPKLPNVQVTSEYISSDGNYINDLSIELLQVDSIGDDGIPISYTVTYLTTCYLHYQDGTLHNPPYKINFSEAGSYSWTAEKVNLGFIHTTNYAPRVPVNHFDRLPRSNGRERHATCPLQFRPEQWYYVRFGSSQYRGIFFIIDKGGRETQHPVYKSKGHSQP